MVRFGIVGVGGYGEKHLDRFRELESAGQIAVTALSDTSPLQLEKAQKLFPKAHSHLDYRSLLDQDDVEAVLLATPIPLHAEMAEAAIQRGLFVLLEKPAVPLFSQWRQLVAFETEPRVAVAFQRISSPGLVILRKLIHEGELGSIRSISVSAIWPRTDWYYQRNSWAGRLFWNSRPVLDGPATNAMAHYLNDIMFLGGENGGSGLPDEVSGELYRARNIPAYDTACLRGRLQNGVRFFAGFSHAATQEIKAQTRIEGSKGTVWVGQNGALHSETIAIPPFDPNDGTKAMLQNFVDFAEGRRLRPDVTLADVEGYTLLTNMMFQSSGGIRTIPTESFRVRSDSRGEKVFEIDGIGAILTRANNLCCPLSEAGASWAQSGSSLKRKSFSEPALLAAVGNPVGFDMATGAKSCLV